MAKNLSILMVLLAGLPLAAAPPRTIAEATKNFHELTGFVPMWWDEAEGKLFLQIGVWNHEFLYLASLLKPV